MEQLSNTPDSSATSKAKLESLSTNDRKFLHGWLQQLRAQYDALPVPPQKEPVHLTIDKILNQRECELDWEDLYKLEYLLLGVLPVAALQARAPMLQEEYNQLAGKNDVSVTDAAAPNAAQGQELRDRMQAVQNEINWFYTAAWRFEELRSCLSAALKNWMFILLTVWTLIAAFAAWGEPHLIKYFQQDANSSSDPLRLTAVMIALAGAVGGAVSALQRVQSVSFKPNDNSLIELSRSMDTGQLSLLYGAIFATVLFFIFAGGLVEGALFPEIPDGLDVYRVGESIFGATLAKVLVWSFIAGFAERFVPDKLNQIAAKTE